MRRPRSRRPARKEALLGTNPIGAAFPLPDADPIVLDMATSVVARSRIRYMLALGQKTIPDGWALDPDGKPTIDPAVAVKGSVLPIGGPKGYALSLMVELLCSALSDGEPGFQVTYENVVKRPSTISQFFFAMNPEGFVGLDRYGKRAAHIADKVKRRQADRRRVAAAAAGRARAGDRPQEPRRGLASCSTTCGTR